ncbi:MULTISPECIES: hypothetical protein [unclassified Moorena]|uniref:hypothetical protein n=1 Tax=unclassified Moorena TaxID=2683338 RepID=UPI0013FB05BB|nr:MULTISPECIES: hypothetical protein [unclassified Moorena]NEO14343.1 hypothetical protein [Moorena sp. SIO3E8]NEP28364.1 hypothetical protein [Moorena sp. SIO3I6]NEQ00368.1 hypothetical protein [Moorena sp. SIO3F7]
MIWFVSCFSSVLIRWWAVSSNAMFLRNRFANALLGESVWFTAHPTSTVINRLVGSAEQWALA